MVEAMMIVGSTMSGIAAMEFARRTILGRHMERAVGRWEPKALVLVAVRSEPPRADCVADDVPVGNWRAS